VLNLAAQLWRKFLLDGKFPKSNALPFELKLKTQLKEVVRGDKVS